MSLLLIPFTDWAHNAHSVPFEQSKNAYFVPSLSGVLMLYHCHMSNLRNDNVAYLFFFFFSCCLSLRGDVQIHKGIPRKAAEVGGCCHELPPSYTHKAGMSQCFMGIKCN